MDTTMPAIVPLAVTAAQPTAGRTRPCVIRAITHEAEITATGLPTTYPSTIPRVIGELIALLRKGPSIVMPAFAKAKSGTIT